MARRKEPTGIEVALTALVAVVLFAFLAVPEEDNRPRKKRRKKTKPKIMENDITGALVTDSWNKVCGASSGTNGDCNVLGKMPDGMFLVHCTGLYYIAVLENKKTSDKNHGNQLATVINNLRSPPGWYEFMERMLTSHGPDIVALLSPDRIIAVAAGTQYTLEQVNDIRFKIMSLGVPLAIVDHDQQLGVDLTKLPQVTTNLDWNGLESECKKARY
jgi:hypothetical protein